MNHFQSIKEFIKKYNEGFHKEFPELKDININFNEKTYSKVCGLSYDERLERGIVLLAKLMCEEKIKMVPSSTMIQNNYPKYRKINDMFRNDGGKNYWLSITRKEDGYNKLCDILGYKADMDVTPKDYYVNIQNLIDDLIHMKNVGNGMWIGVRHDLFKNDFRIRRIHNYIGRECKTVVNFRNKYSNVLSEIGFIYKGKNTKLV